MVIYNETEHPTEFLFFVEPACGKARHSCYNFGKVYVHVCIPSSRFVWAITPTFMHGFQNFLALLLSMRRRSAI